MAGRWWSGEVGRVGRSVRSCGGGGAPHPPLADRRRVFDLTLYPRVAQRDCCRAKSDLRSESCSKPEAQSARDGRNRRTERKKGGREQELRNSQEKRP